MARVLVLGGGMVGTVIAEDLARDHAVTLADKRPAALARAATRIPGLSTVEADLSDPARITELAREHDLVCGALASVLGYGALRAVIEAGRPYCDISFMPEDAWELDALAQERGVTAVVDCGVAPGMSNLLSGYGRALLDKADRIEIWVGGLPVERRWPFQYKAGFAPSDVLEEYTRPARVVENGQVVVKAALSEPELMDLPGVGTVESVLTDGLRSLAFTLDAPHMREMTLRWPGHYDLMRVFRETGLFSKELIEVNGQQVRPLDVTSALLFPKWQYQPGEADLTVMRVRVSGTKDGASQTHTWDLLDYADPVTGNTSMSRTTAFPCTIVAREILAGNIAQKGVIVPERLGSIPGLPERIFVELAKRGVRYGYAQT